MRRGKVRGLAFRGQPLGITPAYAGKSHRCYQQCRDGEDHPHVCGEKWKVSAAMLALTGSPPRMRGKAGGPVVGVDDGGITPTYAGKSGRSARPCWRSRDHPRVCGEKATCGCCIWPYPGSPPHMRGKGSPCPARMCSGGITPAFAGKRVRDSFCKDIRWDHPRVCGEKIMPFAHSSHVFRITPAFAGKRWHYGIFPATVWDHPRVCGEKCKGEIVERGREGSPPRMRGKADAHAVHGSGFGITPAYTGKSK